MKYSVILVFLIIVFSYSQLSFAQLQNSVGLSYDECQKQILDQMNKTASSIDKSKAISLAQSSAEFQSKVTKFKHTFSGIFTNMTWNDYACGDVNLKDVAVQFSILNDKGIFEKFVQVDENPDLNKVIRVRDVFVETCDKNCPPAGPPALDLQEINPADSDMIQAQCLDGSQLLRQGIVDIVQLGDEGKFYVNKESKIISSIINRDAKSQTVHIQLEITSPHPDIKVDQTKQIVFDNCKSRAIVEWHFTPKVPGKHKITLKEIEGGNGYSTSIEVKDPSGKSIKDYIQSPLKQLESGIVPEKTICQVPLQLIIRSDDHASCVKPTSVTRLWDSGWARKSTDIYTKHATKEVLEKFQSGILSKEKVIEIAQDYIRQNNLILNVNMSKPEFRITTDLVYSILSEGYLGALDVDPKTGLPTSLMPPWSEKYYRNPQWWTELQKDYLGMKSNRIENGEFVWRVAWRECPDCIAPYPEFFVDAINGKVIWPPPNELSLR